MILLALDNPTPIAPTGAVATAVGWVMIGAFWIGAAVVGFMLGHSAAARGTGIEATETRRARYAPALIIAGVLIAAIVLSNFLNPLPVSVALVVLVGVGVVALVGWLASRPDDLSKSTNR